LNRGSNRAKGCLPTKPALGGCPVATIVIGIPTDLKFLAEPISLLLRQLEGVVAGALGGKAVDYAVVERKVAEATAGVERAAHQAVLQSLDIDRPAVLVAGKRHVKVGRCSGTYYTMAGQVSVERTLYRESGRREARAVDAVSLRAGVVADGWLPQTARAMAHQVQQAPSREAVASAGQLCRLPYSRCAFEDVAHAVGALLAPVQVDVEAALIEEYTVPAEARSVSVSLDRVTVPIEVARPRPPGRPKKRAAKRPVARVFRQAYCGTVTLHDAAGEALHTLRYGRMPAGGADKLCEGMAGDVWALLEQRPELRVAILCDGAPEMWNLLRAQIHEGVLGTRVHELLDFWHLLEKLGAAARVMFGESGAAAVLGRWRLELLNRASAASAILGELRASGKEGERVGESKPVHEAITYLDHHAERMNYARARRLGLPIGSGNVEATCKSLFEVRMKRGSPRWKEPTGEHIVQLRALALSDRWDRAMDITLAPLRRPVKAAA